MSLESLRKTYGRGTRHVVLNRAIRAECPNGNQCLDSIRALESRLKAIEDGATIDPVSLAHLQLRLAYWRSVRDSLAAQLEAKHNVGPNTNRRKRVADGSV